MSRQDRRHPNIAPAKPGNPAAMLGELDRATAQLLANGQTPEQVATYLDEFAESTAESATALLGYRGRRWLVEQLAERRRRLLAGGDQG